MKKKIYTNKVSPTHTYQSSHLRRDDDGKRATDGGKRAANYRAYLQKMTSKFEAPCVSNAHMSIMIFQKREREREREREEGMMIHVTSE